MSWDSGTATDHDDLLDRLITFLTGGALVNGAGTQVPANQAWFVIEDSINPDLGIYTSQVETTREVYLRGPGLAGVLTSFTGVTAPISNPRFTFTPGPTLTIGDEIVISGSASYNGVYNVSAAGAGYFEVGTIGYLGDETGSFLSGSEAIHIDTRRYTVLVGINPSDNWEQIAADSYNSGLDFRLQPGSQIAVVDDDNKSICTLDSSSFAYWFVATGRYYWVMASIGGTTRVFGGGLYLSSGTPSEFPYPIILLGNTRIEGTRWDSTATTHRNFYGIFSQNSSGSFIRHRDGLWIEITSALPNSSTASIWPTYQGITSTVFGLISNQDTPPTYTLLPYIFFSNHGGKNVYGELQGLYYISSQNIVQLDTITQDGFTHVVMQDISETGNNSDYAVLRLE